LRDLLPPDLRESIVLRELNCGDTDRMMEYFESLGDQSRSFFHPHPFDRQHAEEICSDQATGAYRIVAESNGRIVGYAWFNPWKQSPYRTVGIAISDDFQGRGLGGALMDALEAEARRTQVPGLRLTVYKTNQRGVRLYSSRGYRIVGEEGPQHVMELRLD
jgi:ribosomal protein S18 acetylase RimI-like enzyme